MGHGSKSVVHVDVSRNFFDVASGSSARNLIDQWEASGARVYYEDQLAIASSVRIDLKRRSESAVVKGDVTLMLTGAPASSVWTIERSANLDTWSEVTYLRADSQGTATYVASFLDEEVGSYLRIRPSKN
ncbi:MAG: hypothetical protein R3F19_26220 [Verrucomicrobiales bacterium]